MTRDEIKKTLAEYVTVHRDHGVWAADALREQMLDAVTAPCAECVTLRSRVAALEAAGDAMRSPLPGPRPAHVEWDRVRGGK